MRKITLLLILLISISSFAQDNSNISIFHRLIVYNSDNEIMLVKLKNTETWVTPGFYQDSIQFIKKGLHDIALTYGMKISNPELKGIFSMRREIGETKEMLIRNIYHCKYLNGKVHFPENQSFEIGEIKWLTIKDALSIIPFESMRMFIKQTDNFPNQVSGGSISVTRVDNNWKYEIKESFYSIFSTKKKKNKN